MEEALWHFLVGAIWINPLMNFLARPVVRRARKSPGGFVGKGAIWIKPPYYCLMIMNFLAKSLWFKFFKKTGWLKKLLEVDGGIPDRILYICIIKFLIAKPVFWSLLRVKKKDWQKKSRIGWRGVTFFESIRSEICCIVEHPKLL